MPSQFAKSKIFYSNPELILTLINNFEEYSLFLPGCIESKRIKSPEESKVIGRLVFSLINKNYIFESLNTTSNYTVDITQHHGPFKEFKATWRLESIEPNETKVFFDMNFELPMYLQIFARPSLIEKMGNKFLDAFSQQLSK